MMRRISDDHVGEVVDHKHISNLFVIQKSGVWRLATIKDTIKELGQTIIYIAKEDGRLSSGVPYDGEFRRYLGPLELKYHFRVGLTVE